jgi:cell division protein FtsW
MWPASQAQERCWSGWRSSLILAGSTASWRSATSKATRITSHGSRTNGGVTGSGIGGSNSKMGYLPLAHSDFIFAVIADELGLVGSLAVVGGFMCLVFLGIQTALAAPDRFGLLLAGGISAWFGVQAIVNMGGVVNLMPVTGLTLPFFSAGGTSLFVSMVSAGLLLNVSRRAVTTSRAPRTAAIPRVGQARRSRPVLAR